MTEQVKLAAYRLSVYNPGRMSDSEIVAAFVARRDVFERILDDLRQETGETIAQNHLIIGQRGMGKTTLLMRLATELRTAPLRESLIPLTFVEEQYTVDRLSKFWMNALDSLADALEKRDDAERVDRIDAAVRKLEQMLAAKASEVEMEKAARDALLDEIRQLGLRPVLLVDNIQLVFERIAAQQHNLRELLTRPGAPILIGAAPAPPQATHDYELAFYDLFKEHYLSRLSEDEMRGMLLSLADVSGHDQVRRNVQSHPERVAVLHQITGGNPRTAALLFHLYAEDFSPSVFQDLEALLDRVTPYYKARFEELSDQQQIVAGAMANHWDPITSRQLSEQTGLAQNQISPQLDRLQNLGFVEKVRLSATARSGYQIAERFFNIWYLMRSASRRQRRQVEFLIRFLEQFYSPQERRTLARAFACESRMSPDRMMAARAAAHATRDPNLVQDVERRLELDALEQQYTETRQQLKELIDFDAIAPATLAFSEMKRRLIALDVAAADVRPSEFADTVLGSRRMFMYNEREKVALQGNLSPDEVEHIVASTKSEQRLDAGYFGDQPAAWLSGRLKTGQILTLENVEDWNRTVLDADVTQPEYFWLLLDTIPNSVKLQLSDDACEQVCRALRPNDATNDPSAWYTWARYVSEIRYDDAERAYRRVTSLSPDWKAAWIDLGIVLQHLDRYYEAEIALRHAVKLGQHDAYAEFCLGQALNYQRKYAEAEAAYRRSIAIDSRFSFSWAGLGYVLGYQQRDVEAEAAFHRALDIDPINAWLQNHLGAYLFRQGQFHEAVDYYQSAVHYDPRFLTPYENLICIYRDFLLDLDEAARWLFKRKSVSREREETIAIHEALFAAYRGDWKVAGTKLSEGLRAAEKLDTDEPRIWFLVPAVLIHLGYEEQFINLLCQHGFDESLRPWFEAIQAVRLGSDDGFQNIAPEVRSTADWCYRQIMNRLELLPAASGRRKLPTFGRPTAPAGH